MIRISVGLAREGENDKKTESVQDSEEQNSPELKQALGQVIFKCTVCELQFKQVRNQCNKWTAELKKCLSFSSEVWSKNTRTKSYIEYGKYCSGAKW